MEKRAIIASLQARLLDITEEFAALGDMSDDESYIRLVEYARHAGFSRTRVYDLVSKGMPHIATRPIMVPVQSADRWRAARRTRVGRPRKDTKAQGE